MASPAVDGAVRGELAVIEDRMGNSVVTRQYDV